MKKPNSQFELQTIPSTEMNQVCEDQCPNHSSIQNTIACFERTRKRCYSDVLNTLIVWFCMVFDGIVEL